MSASLFLIAILGCGEADAPCRTVRTEEARYESRDACTAATDAAVMRNSDIDYPVVVAQCLREGEDRAEPRADEVKRPPEGRAEVRSSPLSR